jgi:hypothetical protein
LKNAKGCEKMDLSIMEKLDKIAGSRNENE